MAERRRIIGGLITKADLSGVGTTYNDLDSHAHFSYVMELDVTMMNTGNIQPVVDFRIRGLGSGGNLNDDASIVDGIGWQTTATNITSIEQRWITNSPFTYKAWVYTFPII